MSSNVKKAKIAVITSPQVGKPDLGVLENAAEIVYSTNVGLKSALDGARAVFLWDVGMIDELKLHWTWLNAAEWMHVAVVGVDDICFNKLKESPIVLTNAGGIYDLAIAEYVVGAVIAYERNYQRLLKQKAQHAWKPFISSGVAGKNALIIGPGRIGRACARALSALGMHVRGIGRHTTDTDPDFERIDSFEDLEGRIGWAHHIIITAPLTPETHHMINADILGFCRPSSHLVNVGRGPIVYTPGLCNALQQGLIGGATLDVFETEPLDDLSPLWNMSNVMITPHIAGEVDGFEGALIDQFVRNATHWLRGESLECVVDKTLGYEKKRVV